MGSYGEWRPEPNKEYLCPKCRCNDLQYREWESSDGGHEDYQLRCGYCQHKWWSEGIDA